MWKSVQYHSSVVARKSQACIYLGSLSFSRAHTFSMSACSGSHTVPGFSPMRRGGLDRSCAASASVSPIGRASSAMVSQSLTCLSVHSLVHVSPILSTYFFIFDYVWKTPKPRKGLVPAVQCISPLCLFDHDTLRIATSKTEIFALHMVAVRHISASSAADETPTVLAIFQVSANSRLGFFFLPLPRRSCVRHRSTSRGGDTFKTTIDRGSSRWHSL